MRAEVEVAVCSIAQCESMVPEHVIRQAIDILRDEEYIPGTIESEDGLAGCSEYCTEELSWLADIGILERIVGARDVILGYTQQSVRRLIDSRKDPNVSRTELMQKNTCEKRKTKGDGMISRQAARMECIRMILEADHTIPRDRIERAMAVLAGKCIEKPEVVSPEEARQMANLTERQYAKAIKKGYLARVIRGPVEGGEFVGICRESVDRYIAGQYLGK